MDAQVQVEAQVPRRSRSPMLEGANAADRAWVAVLLALGAALLILAGVIVLELYGLARPAFAHHSALSFITGTDWDPVQESFGALPFIYGTLVTSLIAIVLAVPVALGLSLFLSEMSPSWLRPIVMFPVELLAGIPSVVYGLWALFWLVPWLRETVEPFLGHALGWTPLFRGPPLGIGYLAGGLILAIMILPTIASVTVEVLKTVPGPLREAALGLGATRWEAIRIAVIPYARPGILGASILGLGRALGETMAVTMVLGNAPEIHASLFSPGYSLPAVIANEFAEATGAVHTGALAGLALILFGITLLLNLAARLFMRAVGRMPSGAQL